MKELQGLGLKVDLLDHGDRQDASAVIEKTSREIEKDKNDQSVYNQHLDDTKVDTDKMNDQEIADAMGDEGEETIITTEEDNLDEGTIDLGGEE